MDNKKRRKIAILFPAFLGGGAESVALWMIETLYNEYDITLVTFSHPDFDQLNTMYGTHLVDSKFQVLIPFDGTPLPAWLSAGFSKFTLRQHLICWYFRRIKDNYDLAISAFNDMDLGKRGIQYINSPMFAEGHEKSRALLNYPESPLRRINRWIMRKLFGFSTARMMQNFSFANSGWVAKLLKNTFEEMDAQVLYPPVVFAPRSMDWSIRHNGFVCVSRIVPEKRIEDAISIIASVRERGFDVNLLVISGSSDPVYKKGISQLQEKYANWFFIRENITRDELVELLSKYKFGIHTRANEQFGLVVAELMFAGCIPFIPSQGGPVEIVGNHPNLLFDNPEEAVNKIIGVLESTEKQKKILAYLNNQRNLFTLETFQNILREIVQSELSRQGLT